MATGREPNLKLNVTTDTRDVNKGLKEVKQGLKDLDKTGNQALESLGNAFGVDTGKIGQMMSAITGLGEKMSQCGNEGVKAFGNILKAIGPIGGALASIGITAAIAGFRELQKEAEAFKGTVEGANMEMATAAYVSTYRQTLRDMGGDVGKSMAQAQSSWKKFWGEFRGVVSDYFTGGGFFNPLGAAQNAGETQRYKFAAENAEKAERLTNQIYELERRRKEQAIELARLNDDIAAKMNTARDASASLEERQDAIYKIELMLSQKKTMSVSLEEELAKLYRQRSDLATDSVAAADATLAQETRAYDVSRAITQEQNALLRIKNSIGKASEAELAAAQKQTEELAKQKRLLDEHIKAARARGAELASLFNGAPTLTGQATGPQMTLRTEAVDEFKSRLVADMGEVTLYVGLKTDTQKVQDISNEITSLLQSGVSRTAEILGDLFGTLAGGGDAWGDFKNAALSAFGDLAIAVGKIAISTGLASEGIQAALKMDNPYIAIAAGAALVALGSAVKASLSAVANGDYSAAGGAYSSTASSAGSGDYDTREVNVNVNGTLQADGDQLLAVINATNNRNYYTR